MTTPGPQPPAIASPSPPSNPWKFWIRELIAIAFWIYAILKLFVYDVDIYLVTRIDPQLLWIIHYRFFILISVIAFSLIATRKRWSLAGWFLYIVFYPFVLFFWRIPYAMYRRRDWTLAFAAANSLVSLFHTFKYKFVWITLFLLSLLCTIKIAEPTMLIISGFILLGLTISSYIRIAFLVTKPSRIFQVYSILLSRSPEFFLSKLTDRDIRNLPIETLSETQLDVRRSNIQTLVIVNRFALFFARRLRDYQESKLHAVGFTLTLLTVLVFTMVAFAGINYALFKAEPYQFATTEPGTFSLFLYYSFRSFVFGSIPEITPISLYSRILSVFEQGLAIVLLFFIITLFISIQNDRYKEQLAKTIQDAEKTGEVLKEMLQNNYQVTLDQAMIEIQKMKSNMMGLVVWLTRSIQ